MDTKTAEQAKANWVESHGRIPAKYAEGVKGASGVIDKAIAGEALYAERLAETIANKKRARKLSEVSDEQWRTATLDKGAKRIVSGMKASEAKFGTGIGKVISVLQGITLPDRVADPAANVANRVTPIAVELHKLKE